MVSSGFRLNRLWQLTARAYQDEIELRLESINKLSGNMCQASRMMVDACPCVVLIEGGCHAIVLRSGMDVVLGKPIA